MTATTYSDTLTATAPPQDRESRFNSLISVYMDDLYRYAYWLTHDRAVADDLVQETMVRAWKSMDRLQNPKAVKGWLITILRRENARRFERYQPKQSAIPTEELAAKKAEYDTSTEAFALRRALERLPEDYREPLLLQVIHGYSQKEIAAQLGLSSAGAGTRLFRARQKLRKMLDHEPN
jgi:RNA polymerase sigma-70 factor (ECF subfamily)